MTPRTGVLLATLLVGAAGVYGCNAIFGIEDVTLAKDAGPDATADAPGMDAAADTGVDATLVDAGMEAAADTGIDAGMEAAPMPCADAADFLFDPRNCGACGHDCLRGACDGGQ